MIAARPYPTTLFTSTFSRTTVEANADKTKKVVETALRNKIHVITPNKALISKHGDYLAKLAEDNNVNLEFEASVAGGIPILRTIKEGLATNKITKVFGILNGTSNYILSEMRDSNDSFANVLKKAQI